MPVIALGARHKDTVLGEKMCINVNQMQDKDIVLQYGRWQTGGHRPNLLLKCVILAGKEF